MAKGNVCLESNTIYMIKASVFQAEVYAINDILNFINVSPKYRDSKVEVLSDNLAAIPSMSGRKCFSNLATEMRRLTIRMDDKILWIKAHNDTSGNELTDVVAKEVINPIRTKVIKNVP